LANEHQQRSVTQIVSDNRIQQKRPVWQFKFLLNKKFSRKEEALLDVCLCCLRKKPAEAGKFRSFCNIKLSYRLHDLRYPVRISRSLPIWAKSCVKHQLKWTL